MEHKDKISLIDELKNQYINESRLLDEIWQYHPQNPDFINPIKAHDEINGRLDDLERRIKSLEREINSLN